jgi:hypothetical protein
LLDLGCNNSNRSILKTNKHSILNKFAYQKIEKNEKKRTSIECFADTLDTET